MDLKLEAKKIVLKNAEAMAKELVTVCYEPAVDEVKAKVAALIPGAIDDAVIELVVKAFSPQLKAALLAKIELINQEEVAA